MIRVGTRGSALALAQAAWVAERLAEETELVEVITAGDRGTGEPDKSRWVSELERRLLDDEIDVAVHSAKDVPAQLPEGLELVAIPERAEAVDAICGAPSLDVLAAGSRVGTSSLRRAAQIRAGWPHLEVVPMRGNVDTRLRKLARGECDALILALAGLRRLDREEEAHGVLDQLVPAAGQGALAVEAKIGRLSEETLNGLRDEQAAASVLAEREVVRALGASCYTPLGVHARIRGPEMELSVWLGVADGSHWISDRITGDAAGLAGRLVERILAVGAAELLRAAEAGG